MPTKLEKQQEKELNSLSALASVQLTKIKRLQKRIETLERRIEKLEAANDARRETYMIDVV